MDLLGWPYCEFYWYARAVSECLTCPSSFSSSFSGHLSQFELTPVHLSLYDSFWFARISWLKLIVGGRVKVSTVPDRLDYEDGMPKSTYRREQVRFLINRALKCKSLLVLVNHDQPNLTESIALSVQTSLFCIPVNIFMSNSRYESH
jgi:hypothetical protein